MSHVVALVAKSLRAVATNADRNPGVFWKLCRTSGTKAWWVQSCRACGRRRALVVPISWMSSSLSLARALSSLGRASVADRVDAASAGGGGGAAAAAAGLATTSTTLSSPSLPSLESSITIRGTEGDMIVTYSHSQGRPLSTPEQVDSRKRCPRNANRQVGFARLLAPFWRRWRNFGGIIYFYFAPNSSGRRAATS